MKCYKHIFFDLDHTLWDFDRCSAETLLELYDKYRLDRVADLHPDEFLEAFSEVNYHLWGLYNHNQIDKQYIRDNRFILIFRALGISEDLVPTGIGQEYLYRCPQKPYLMEHTHEALEHLLSKSYRLHILTNGFSDVQQIKMKSSGITHYFDCVITSECTGHKKPSKEIFEYALQRAGAHTNNSVMVGDSLDADIRGALNAGIAPVFYNPGKKTHQETVTEISCLSELTRLF